MKIRQLWKLNQQYLQETMVFRSRRFSGTCHEVMRKTELRRVPMRMLKCGVPRTKLMCQKCAEQLQNRCHLHKGPWDSEIQLCWYEKYIYLKNELLFYYSTSTGCLFMQPLPTLKRPFSVPIFENGVLIWVFFFSGPPQSFLPKPTDGTDGTRFHSKKWCHHLGLHPTLFLGRFSIFFQMWIFEATPK